MWDTRSRYMFIGDLHGATVHTQEATYLYTHTNTQVDVAYRHDSSNVGRRREC